MTRFLGFYEIAGLGIVAAWDNGTAYRLHHYVNEPGQRRAPNEPLLWWEPLTPPVPRPTEDQ